MREALIFNGANALDFQDIRTNVVRIPEVVHRIRQAQELWDDCSPEPLDLANFIGSDDSVFLGHIKLRNFASAIVQIGLMDRFLKNHDMPQFLIGATNGDSALKIALKQISFTDLVVDSPAMPKTEENGIAVPSPEVTMPKLSGVQLTEFGVYQQSPQGYQRLYFPTMAVERMIEMAVGQHGIGRLIFVGPGNGLMDRGGLARRSEVEIVESIDLDPMLSWFWRHLKENRLAVAN